MRPHDDERHGYVLAWRKNLRRLRRRLRKGHQGQKRATGAQQRQTLWLMVHS